MFEDRDARLRLNLLIHPLVTAEHQRRLAAHRARGVAVIVADIPLLLEGKKAGTGTGAILPFDVIAVVYATQAQQLERIVARDKLAPEDARARIAAQLPIEEKRALADVIIDNSGPWEATEKQVRELVRGLASAACALHRRAELRDEVAGAADRRVAVGRGSDSRDERAADDHAVGQARDLRGLRGGGDAEADADRCRGDPADPVDELRRGPTAARRARRSRP